MSVVSRPLSVARRGGDAGTDNGPRTTDNRPLFADPIAERMRTVTEYRRRILAARDDKPYEQLRQELDVADEALSLARLVGDCVVAAFFSASKDRDRLARLDELSKQLVQYLGPKGQIGDRQPLKQAQKSLQQGEHPIQPFHWEIEFPEVFDRQLAVGSQSVVSRQWAVVEGRRVRRREDSEAEMVAGLMRLSGIRRLRARTR
jgi:hypothetical protein